MSKNNSRKDTSQRKTLEGISQEEWLDVHLRGFEKWIQQYKRIVIDKLPHMALGDIPIASDKQTQSSQLQEAFLDVWKIIITKVVSPENIEQVRNTLDDLMGDYDFLEQKIKRRFGNTYGLEGFKTGSTKKKSKDYEPRRLHMKFIQTQLESGVLKAATAWDNFVHEGLKGSSVIDGENFRIETKNSIKHVISESEQYPIDRTFFCDVFRDRKRKRAEQIKKIKQIKSESN